ncbi:MAG: chemotaxis protein CheW [Nitrospinae bacterium]|nr:chemotaxis protein CheW [Nitrospinota bacterium]
MDDQELLGEIILESKEHLGRIEPDLLSLEENTQEISADLVNRLFRTMHSIKGGFAFMGLHNISELAHALENVLARLRDGQIKVTPGLVDVLLAGVDKITEMIDNASVSESMSTQEIKEKLAPFAGEHGGGGAEPEVTAIAVESVLEEAPVAQPQPVAVTPVRETVKPPSEGKHSQQPKGGDAVRVKVSTLDRLVNLAAELVFARNQMISALNVKAIEALDRARVMEVVDAAAGEAGRNIISHAVRAGANGAEGRAVFEKAVKRELDSLKRAFTGAVSAPLAETPVVKGAARQVNFVTTELQESIMGTRLQPVGTVFGKLPRIIRDLTRSLGKQINIELHGEEVELDKSIIETLSDPLTHIIRNCGDHGIEAPDVREKAGKPAEGRVRVAAYQEGGQVYIEITDDGRGIDPAAVRRKAVEKGILTPERAGEMTDAEAQALIFAPGFSTAQTVTDVSGRGVGMDVVKTNIESLGGSVELHSVAGEGTRLLLKLPLTMAIIPALVVEAEGRRYAIPQASIDELTRVRGCDISSSIENLGGAPVIRRQGRLLPLVYLAGLFGLRKTFYDPKAGGAREDRRGQLVDRRKRPLDQQNAGESGEDPAAERPRGPDRRKSLANALQIVALKVGAHRFGLIVDTLLDTEEIVVKPLSSYLKKCVCYSGATIMGDGKVTMILDPAGITSFTKMKFEAVDKEFEAAQRAKKHAQMAERQSLLLFKAGGQEVFAINLDLANRVERVSAERIKPVGEKEFLNYADYSMRILRLEEYLPVSRPSERPERFFALIPKLVKNPMGIVASEIVDIIKSDVKIDRDKVKGTGIFGTGVIEGQMVIFLDIYGLFEAAEPEIHAHLAVKGKLAGRRILLAEDTAFFRTVTTKYLEEQGCEVRAVIDGQYAWETLLAGEKFDALLTDINMPRMNGLELTKKIRASGKFPGLPIVTLTSMGLERDKKVGYEAGVDHYELKLDKERLLETLRGIFGKGK